MAHRVKKAGYVPQLLVASPALRTESTANIFAEHLSLRQPVTNSAIYEGSYRILLDIINAFNDEQDFIGIVGHNPDISDLLTCLTGEVKGVPPCATAVINFEFDDWRLISANTGTLLWYSTPDED
jgi:phosphohistidine phosphatase